MDAGRETNDTETSHFARKGPGADAPGCVPPSIWKTVLDAGGGNETAGKELSKLLETIGRESRIARELADGVLAPLKPFWGAGRCREFVEKPPPPYYPDAVQDASLRLPALFASTAKGDFHAFALALQSLELLRALSAFPCSGFDETVWGVVALIGVDLDDADFESDTRENAESWRKAVDAATDKLLELGMKAGIGEAFWRKAIQEATGLDVISGGWSPVAERLLKRLETAVDLDCPDAMPAADSFREWLALETELDFLAPEERCRRIAAIASRGWRFTGPLAGDDPSPPGPSLDDFASLCRSGEPLALASLARAVLGGDWRGDAYGPWRIAPNPFGVKDVPAFAERVFRERAAAGDAFGCFYLGQLAWKRAFDRIETIRARRSDGTETRLRFLDRDRRFLEVPCAEADLWFRRGAALGGRGARECERTLAWRAVASRGVAG